MTEREQAIVDAALKAAAEYGGDSVTLGSRGGALVMLRVAARGRFLNVYVSADDDADTIRAEIVRQIAPASALS